MKTLLLILSCFSAQLLYAQPKITSFSPASGPIGTTVTITGTGFSSTPTNNIVFFGAVRGTVSTASATSLSVTVPAGASYQFITVTTAGLMGNSRKPFTATFPGGGAISELSFASPVNYSNGFDRTAFLAVKDFDNDGKGDIANSPVLIYKNNSTPGSTALASPVDINNNSGAGLGYVQSEDLDGDGKPDIVATDKIIKNTSTGGTLSFAAPADFILGGPTAIIDFDGDGLPDLARGLSSFASIYRNTSFGGIISFATYTSSAGYPSTSTGVEAAYLNSDDKPDYVSSAKPDYFIRTGINNSTPGNLSFTQGPILYVPTDANQGVQSIAVADFDGDDEPDVVATWKRPSTGENFISIFKNTSVGASTSFADRIDYLVASTSATKVIVSDIDGDGKPEIAVLISGGAAIFRNTCSPGTISFENGINITSPTSAAFQIADVDGDGKPDLCFGGYNSATSISILRNTIETPNVTSFSPSEACTGTTITITGTNLIGATAVSIGGVAVTSFTVLSNTTINAVLGTGASGIVSVTTPLGTATKDGFTYTGACNLTPKITSFTPSSAPAGTLVTIKGQKFSTTASNNTVYFGAVKAAISSAIDTSLIVTVPAGATNSPITVTVNNLTGYSSTSFTLTFTGATNNPLTANSFGAKHDFSTGNSPFGAVINDIDGNNQPDVITANFSSNNISSLRNISASPSIAFAEHSDGVAGSQPIGIAYGDLDGDGKPDVATVNNSSNSVSVFLNTSSTGLASYATKIDFATGIGPRGIYVRDVDLDGKADLLITNFSDNTVSVLRNTSSGSGSTSFATQVTFATGTGPYGIFVQDVDGDNIPDIEVANSQSGTISILKNISTAIGNIAFAAKVDFIAGSQPVGIFVNDLDSDEKPDIEVSNSSSATVSVFKNSSSAGSISFDPKTDYVAGSGPFSIAVADLNGDGKADISTANAYDNTVSVLRNTGTGGTMSFDAKVDYPTGNNPRSISIGDIDGDGKADIVSANYNDNTISVLSNMVSSVLPITFQSINARLSGNDGILTWTTQSEANIKSFIVRRSTDGIDYKTAGLVPATGNSSTIQQYSFTDAGAKTLSSRNLYYRIEMVNRDGTFTYSSVAILSVDENNINIIAAAPNPFTDNFTLKISSAKKVNTFIIITDATGKVVLRQNEVLFEGNNNINVKGANLSKGLYNVQVLADTINTSFKTLKQ